MKPIIIFRCNSLLNNETKELIRNDLKQQIKEGIVITDISLEYAKTLIPKNCECEIIIESSEEISKGKIVSTTMKKVPRFFQKLFKNKNKQ